MEKTMSKQEKKISFDLWWVLTNKTREEEFPIWMKEIFKVDFKARGYEKEETRTKYDVALKQFGY
jgi:hypothetical protein